MLCVIIGYKTILLQVIQNTSIELLLISAGGGGASSHFTNETGNIDSRGLVNPWKNYINSPKIPQNAIDAGTLKFIFVLSFILVYGI